MRAAEWAGTCDEGAHTNSCHAPCDSHPVSIRATRSEVVTALVAHKFPTMRNKLLFVLLALGISASASAADSSGHAPIAFVIPGGSNTTIDKTKYLFLVVEGAFISHDGNPVAAEAVVEYVNNALKAQGATMLAVHIRQGIKFGDVVQALDALRKTEAKSIGVSMVELAPNKEP